jgi:hypothetical protein
MSFVLMALLAGAASGMPHPPGNAKLGPSKADPFVKAAMQAKAKGDTKAFDAAILEAKRILAAEGRYACCIGGGCTECTIEKSCGCGQSLFEKQGVCKECVAGIKAGKSRYDGLSPDMVFEQLSKRMAEALSLWDKGAQFALIRKAWLARAAGRGERISVRTGESAREGLFRDIDEEGRLVLEGAEGLETVLAGDVFFLPPQSRGLSA